MQETMKFQFSGDKDKNPKKILELVYQALQDKGYDPINQIVGYLISGDPAYIPRHQHARAMIKMVERDEIIEELVKFYLQQPIKEEADGKS